MEETNELPVAAAEEEEEEEEIELNDLIEEVGPIIGVEEENATFEEKNKFELAAEEERIEEIPDEEKPEEIPPVDEMTTGGLAEPRF